MDRVYVVTVTFTSDSTEDNCWRIDVRLMFTCMMWHRHRCKVRLLFDMVDIGTASCESVRNAFEERNITCQ